MVPCFLHLLIMALIVVCWSPKALEVACSRLRCVSDFVSHLFLNFFGLVVHVAVIFEIFQTTSC